MLRFYKKYEEDGKSVFSLENEGREIAFAEAEVNRIRTLSFINERDRIMLTPFAVRSLVFLLRDKYDEIFSDFVDETLALIGFTEDGDGMRANSLEINFDTCSKEAKNENGHRNS